MYIRCEYLRCRSSNFDPLAEECRVKGVICEICKNNPGKNKNYGCHFALDILK